jgi:cell wall-associated NlpC family hydrolase
MTLTIAEQEKLQRNLVIAEAQSWLGTPFHENAAIKGVGVDCGRFLVHCFQAAGVKVPDLSDSANYPHGWHLHRSDERYLNLISQFTKITQFPLPGNIVMYRIGRGYAHSGIIVNYPEIIHSAPPCVSKANAEQIKHVNHRDKLFLTPWSL